MIILLGKDAVQTQLLKRDVNQSISPLPKVRFLRRQLPMTISIGLLLIVRNLSRDPVHVMGVITEINGHQDVMKDQHVAPEDSVQIHKVIPTALCDQIFVS